MALVIKLRPTSPSWAGKIETTFGATSLPTIAGESWQPVFHELLSGLPAGIQQRLEKESNLPLDQRTPAFSAFSNLLQTTARALAQIAVLSQPVDAESLQAVRTHLNFMVPIAALKGMLTSQSDLGQTIRGFIDNRGANDRNFDGFNNQLNQLSRSFTLLSAVNDALG